MKHYVGVLYNQRLELLTGPYENPMDCKHSATHIQMCRTLEAIGKPNGQLVTVTLPDDSQLIGTLEASSN